MYAYAKNILVGIVLAVVAAVAPVWAADESAELALSDSRMAVQERTALALLSTEQLDSVKGGGGNGGGGGGGTQNCTNAAGLIAVGVSLGVGILGQGAGQCIQNN